MLLTTLEGINNPDQHDFIGLQLAKYGVVEVQRRCWRKSI